MTRQFLSWMAWMALMMATYNIAQDVYYYAPLSTIGGYFPGATRSPSFNITRWVFEGTLLWFWWRFK